MVFLLWCSASDDCDYFFLRLRYSGLFIIAVHNCVRNVLAIFILNGVNHLTWFFLICFFFLKPKKFFVCMLSCDIWYYLIMILVFCSVLGYFEAQEWNFGVKFRNSKVFFLSPLPVCYRKGLAWIYGLKLTPRFASNFHKHHLGMKFISVLRNGINGRFIRVFCRLFYIITFIFGSFGINSLKTLNSVFQVLDILRENNNFVIKKKSLSDISSKMVLSIDAVLDLVWVIRPYTS